jgi:hypothetical protein
MRQGQQWLRQRRQQDKVPGQPMQPHQECGDAIPHSVKTQDNQWAVQNMGDSQGSLPPQNQVARQGLLGDCNNHATCHQEW